MQQQHHVGRVAIDFFLYSFHPSLAKGYLQWPVLIQPEGKHDQHVKTCDIFLN